MLTSHERDNDAYLYWCPYDEEWIAGAITFSSPFTPLIGFLPDGEDLVVYVTRSQLKRHDRSEAV